MTVLIRTSTQKTENETRDRKPQQAVRAIGDILDPTVLIEAPRLPASRGSTRTPSVEVVMDLASEIPWPEAGHEQPVDIDEFDANRSHEYSLLAMLLSRSPDAATLNRIARLGGDATPLGLAHLALAQAAGSATAEIIEREYFTLFIGIGRGELLPYGSYYLTGFLNERPLARLREDLRAHGIERVEGQIEPEDHAATLCEIMAGMSSGQFPTADRMQRRFFEKHLASWIGRFFADLERAEAAEFYRQVGTLGRLFLETETEAFRLPTRSELLNLEDE
jgi:TorA maturation chaperone TorD